MAKKNKNGNGESARSAGNKIVGFAACIAILVSVVVFIVNIILHAVGGDLGMVMRILTTIKDVCIVIGLGLPAYYYARGKRKWFKITVFIALVVFLALAILGNMLIN